MDLWENIYLAVSGLLANKMRAILTIDAVNGDVGVFSPVLYGARTNVFVYTDTSWSTMSKC